MSAPVWRLLDATLAGRVAFPGELEIEPGITAVLGGSGAGKSSLLELLVGHAVPHGGRVDLCAQGTAPQLPLYWAPQGHGLWPGISAQRHLELVAPARATRPIAAWLADFELTHVAEHPPERLSMGERGRLAGARALASEAAVIVLDEPFAGTDAHKLERCWAALRSDQARTGATVVYATHDPSHVLGWATRVLALDRGTVAWCGATLSLYDAPPDERLAWLLGPLNWWPIAERAGWFPSAGPEHPCVRPERLAVVPFAAGEIEVAACRFAGAIAELELVLRSTAERRRIYARPPHALVPGTAVRLGWHE